MVNVRPDLPVSRGMTARGLVIAILMAGCGGGSTPAWKQHLQAGRGLMQAGDPIRGALELRAACDANPTHASACREASAAAMQARPRLLESARWACARPTPLLEDCTRALTLWRGIDPLDPELRALAEAAGTAQARLCGAERPFTPAVAVDALRCMQAVGARADALPGFAAKRDEVARRGAAVLAEAASHATTPGAALALWQTAQCMWPTPERARAAAASDRALRDSRLLPVAVTTSARREAPATLGEVACASAQKTLADRIRCVAPGTPGALAVNLELDLGAPDHQVFSESRSARWLRATLHVPNPAHRSALVTLQMAEDTLARLDAEAQQYEEPCRRARDQVAQCSADCEPARSIERSRCSDVDSWRQRRDQAARDVREARDQVSSTPATLDEEQWDTGEYVARIHRWEAAFGVTVSIPGAPGKTERGTLRAGDVEHAGFQPADIPPDRYDPPGPGAFAAMLAERAGARLTEVARAALAARAPACPPGPLWSEAQLTCWAEAELLTGDGKPNAGRQLGGLTCQ